MGARRFHYVNETYMLVNSNKCRIDLVHIITFELVDSDSTP